jgi:hypothetical protein
MTLTTNAYIHCPGYEYVTFLLIRVCVQVVYPAACFAAHPHSGVGAVLRSRSPSQPSASPTPSVLRSRSGLLPHCSARPGSGTHAQAPSRCHRGAHGTFQQSTSSAHSAGYRGLENCISGIVDEGGSSGLTFGFRNLYNPSMMSCSRLILLQVGVVYLRDLEVVRDIVWVRIGQGMIVAFYGFSVAAKRTSLNGSRVAIRSRDKPPELLEAVALSLPKTYVIRTIDA